MEKETTTKESKMNERIKNLIEELEVTGANDRLLAILRESKEEDFIYHDDGDISMIDPYNESGITASCGTGTVVIFENIDENNDW
jgi:hypothetical protein